MGGVGEGGEEWLGELWEGLKRNAHLIFLEKRKNCEILEKCHLYEIRGVREDCHFFKQKCIYIFFGGGKVDIFNGTYWENIKIYILRSVSNDLFGRKLNAFLLSKRRKRKLSFRNP